MRSVAALLTFAASALAYSVSEPNNSTGWTTSGPNKVSWTKVDTDPANFTIVLVNQQVNPAVQQVLDALVDGSLGSVVVNPPSEGWKAGSGYQVNLVKDTLDLNTILAQSGQFTIAVSSSSTFSSSTGSSTLSISNTNTNTAAATTTTNAGSTAGSTSGTVSPSTSDISTSPTTSNAATPAMGMQTGLFAVLALFGAVLA
ncbi:hypothetical protein A0H81_03777 [Grifola frondosa]|uniref:Yeast cell wall synthesis Kre9/Knh1-like N-terminal domain-containing protein n=1 Tax=Grifola frondosa TaxID=5627 RepID=A0A1C7MJG9_GRIFR|nr:hypothetical protein A0H81_03777 [Grifola frondosa]